MGKEEAEDLAVQSQLKLLAGLTQTQHIKSLGS